jgi:hypothetical protein
VPIVTLADELGVPFFDVNRRVAADARPGMSLSRAGSDFVLDVGAPFDPARDLDEHLLLRLWRNDEPFLPSGPVDPRLRGIKFRMGSHFSSRASRLTFGLDLLGLSVRSGDRVGVQVLWTGGGWRASDDEEASVFGWGDRWALSNRVDFTIR